MKKSPRRRSTTSSPSRRRSKSPSRKASPRSGKQVKKVRSASRDEVDEQEEQIIYGLQEGKLRRRPPFVLVAVLHAVGVFLFVSGFLLTRKELSVHASCSDPQASCPKSGIPCESAYAGPDGCSVSRTVPNFRFVLLLIVDAIRFDFIPQFKSVETILQEHPSKTRIFDFVADAPTTTMQRLKALTTGGLPTFVDMGRSFEAGIDIQEDNWVHQAVRGGHEMRIVGDDTWVSLYPEHRVTEALPFPSLNVKDIDGCDEHVIAHFPEQLRKAAASGGNGSSIVVGHFLGVDHIGHRFGIEHPEMQRKVQQMDAFVAEMVQWAQATSAEGKGETLLLLFGDHGQTVNGDHGGATAEEVESFLFAFSSADLIDDPFRGALPEPDDPPAVQQFLGPSSVPFRDFLAGGAHASFAGRQTASRILQSDFVPTISAAVGLPIPFGSLGSVTWRLLRSQGGAQDLLNVLALYRSNARQVQHFLVEYQAQTAESLPKDMVASASRLFDAAEASFAGAAEGQPKSIAAAVAAYQRYLRHVGGAARQAWATFDERRMLAGVGVLLLAAAVASRGMVEELRSLRVGGRADALVVGGVGACLLLHGASLFSNSYIVNGRGVTHFLATTLLAVWGLSRIRAGGEEARRVWWVGLMMVLGRCTLAYTSLPFEKGVQEAGWTSLCAAAGMLGLHAVRFAWGGGRGGLDVAMWAASVGCTGWYWLLQLTQQLESAPGALRLGLPRAAYALALCHSAVVLGRPRVEAPAGSGGAGQLAGMHRAMEVLSPVASLILGAGSAVSVALAAMQVRCLWTVADGAAGAGSRVVREVLLCLLATELFYSSGHRPTFEGVQYGAAFQGIDDVSDSMAHALAGILVVLNTYGAYILMVPVSFGTGPRDGTVVLFFFSLTLALTVVFVGLTRRHLMVWAIFAPKMVYDVIIAAMVDIVFLGSMLLARRE